MIKNNYDEKTTANKLAKETLALTLMNNLDQVYGDKDDLKDNDRFTDMYHWFSIEPIRLLEMTNKERIEFDRLIQKHLRRLIKIIE
tara:strand:- start:1067 stop:1324 length:258 start_codon:yes stop_codon:yes gene_type:complete